MAFAKTLISKLDKYLEKKYAPVCEKQKFECSVIQKKYDYKLMPVFQIERL